MSPRSGISRQMVPASLARFCGSENGATAIEYGIIGVVMAIGILAAFPLLKEPLETLATTIGDAMG